MLDAVAFTGQIHRTAPESGKRLQQAGRIVHAITAIRTRSDHGDIKPDRSRIRVGIGFCGWFAAGARVLDAGCGTGYGTAHLLQRGATSVLGVDSSARAVEFSTSRYGHASGPSFRVTDICQSGQLAPQSFDVIFCNIAEHLADVDAFLANCRELLSPRGVLVMAVPAIANPGILEGNMRNPYHITHMPPKSWLTKLGRYLYAVQGFRHRSEEHTSELQSLRHLVCR